MEWITWSLCFYFIIGWCVLAAVLVYACCVLSGRADDAAGRGD